MVEKLMKDNELVDLNDYLIPEKFRTVRDEGMLIDGGITEVKVVVNMHDKFAKQLTFDVSTMYVIYGFGVMTEKVKEINRSKYASYYGDGILRKITLNDCGERFLMVFDLGKSAPDMVLSVSAEQVKNLLNNCIHSRYEY